MKPLETEWNDTSCSAPLSGVYPISNATCFFHVMLHASERSK